MKQNVGTWDAYMRIMLGLSAIAFGISQSTKKSEITGGFMILCGSMKVAEGITRVCPLLYAMGIETKEETFRKNPNASNEQDRFNASENESSPDEQHQKSHYVSLNNS